MDIAVKPHYELANLVFTNSPKVGRRFIALRSFRLLVLSLIAAIGQSLAGAQTLLFEGAETEPHTYSVGVPSGYDILSTTVNGDTGHHSFHFTHPSYGGVRPADQWLTLPAVTLGSNNQLEFKSMLRYSGFSEEAHVQISVENGAWQDLPTGDGVFTQIGTTSRIGQKGFNGPGEQVFSTRAANLNGASFANKSVRIRFAYIIAPNQYSYYTNTIDSYGWFVDDIKIQSDGVTVLSEGAEIEPHIYTVQIPADYNLICDTIYASANTRSFHLTHPSYGGVRPDDQWLMLPAVTLGSNSRLEFKSMLRYSGFSEEAHVQISVENGAWQDLPTNDGAFTQIGTTSRIGQKGFNGPGELIFTTRTVILNGTPFVNKSVRIRFAYIIAPNQYNYYTNTIDSYGWFVDDVKVINVPSSGNTGPTITSIAPQTTNEDTPLGPITFTVADVETAAGSLTVTASSSNTTLVPNQNIVFGGIGANRTLTVTPAANKSGTCAITVTVSDGSLDSSTSFMLTVNPVNDPPVAQDGTLSLIESAGATGSLVASDVDGDTLAFSVVIAPLKGTVTIINVNTGEFTYTGNPYVIGPDSFTFKATDPAGLSSNVARLTIAAPDTDNDGLPDVWERLTFGNLTQGASNDFDGDGQSNYKEYLAGTNAASNNSFFFVTMAPTSDGLCKLTWPSTPGKTYNVESAANLSSAWSTVATVPAAPSPDTATSWTDTTSGDEPHAFYRVVVVAN